MAMYFHVSVEVIDIVYYITAVNVIFPKKLASSCVNMHVPSVVQHVMFWRSGFVMFVI